ncbi:MAG: T9SS type A sorting domain-containing protein [Bacteroidetes bacterium]|nr:T9SS type A sorting domain-containing protein [Bacteroidota bacterium]
MQKVFLSILATILLTTGAFSQEVHEEEGLAVPLPEERFTLTQQSLQESVSLSKAHSAFRKFVIRNTDWSFRYDAVRGTPHRAWGSGIPIAGYPSIHLLNAPPAGRQFLAEHASVLNIDERNLRLLYSEIVSGKAYQKYVQVHEGIDVLHSYVDLRISPTGRVFMFGSDYHPSIDVNTTPTLSLVAAREFAKVGLPYTESNEHITDGQLYILPVKYPNSITYRLVYNFQVKNGSDEIWDTYVDAHDGSIVWRHDLITHFHGGPGPNATANVVNGRVMIKVYPESYTLEELTLPLMNAYVWVSGKMYVTDQDGRFTADLGSNSTGQLVTQMTGPYARVFRIDSSRSGNPGHAYQTTTVASGQDIELLWDNSNSIASERNTFYHMNLVRDFSRALDPSANNNKLDDQIPGGVEYNDQCNAFFDGRGVTFFKESNQCGNTGQISSVIHHEMGHGIHIWLTQKLTGRGPYNPSLKEAIADMTTNLLRDDPRIGVGFMKAESGLNPHGGTIRNSDNTHRYPEDVLQPEFGAQNYHKNGMILTGAVWDVREAIGLDRTRRLYHDALYGVPDGLTLGNGLADFFMEFLVADDDDGDLSNGTPNSEAIVAAFAAHGIPGSAIEILHEQTADQENVVSPIAITGIARISGGIHPEDLFISSVDLIYSTDSWQSSDRVTAVYNRGTEQFIATIPPMPAGTIIRYYFEASDNFGTSAIHPVSAPEDHYLFLVGFERKFFHDAETEDGWTVQSTASSGEWIRDVPVGTWDERVGKEGEAPYIQPNEDHTPGQGKDKCWVTGNAPRGAGIGDNDIDDGLTEIYTSNYDVSEMIQPVLRYYRWFSNDASANPGQDYWTVRGSSDGGTTWTNLERTKVSNASWQQKTIVLREFVDPTTEFKVRFIATDYEPGSLVEAALDDFEILDINTSLVGVEGQPLLPTSLMLEQNYPNPFNPSTVIRYALPEAAAVRLTVYNSLGDLVRTIVDGRRDAGMHAVTFDASTLPSGLYVYELRVGGERLTRKMLLLE